MEVNVSVGISARHIHLTKENYAKLFDHEMTKKADLNQIGQFAANETVTIKTSKGELKNVRIVGPCREYNQVEIAASDARVLGIDPPVRRSGESSGAAVVEVITEKGKIELDNCIIANRHVHMNPKKAEELGVVNRELLTLEIDGTKKGNLEVEVVVTDNGYFEVHLDTDDANAFLLKSGVQEKLIIR